MSANTCPNIELPPIEAYADAAKPAKTKAGQPAAEKEETPKISPQLAFVHEVANDKNEHRSRDGALYRYDRTHWQAVPIFDLERRALQFCASKFPEKTNEKVAASSAATVVLASPPLGDPAPGLIPVRNGVIRLDSMSLGPHDAAYNLTFCLACAYDVHAEARRFIEFIEGALPDKEVREYLQEYAGYTLLPDCRHQLAVWLIGGGGNGKSTFAQIMQSLHSKPVSMSLDGLDGFKLTGLVGASLVYCDETPARIDEQRLKTLISGDAVQVDRKYRDALTVRPTAKWIVSGNALPAISDHSDGFWRRWVVIPFDTRPGKVVPLLAESIIDNELSGVLNWALEGLKRLLARGAFRPLPDALQAAQNTGKKASNSVAAWLGDVEIKYEEGGKAGFKRSTVYSFYSEWCAKNGMKSVSSIKFWDRMQQVFPGLKSFQRGENRVRCVNILVARPGDD